MPDNMNAPTVPSVLARLSIYLRFQIDPAVDPNPIDLALRGESVLGEKELPLGSVNPETVTKARTQAIDQGKPYAGIIVRSEFVPFAVKNYGRIEVLVRTLQEEIIAGHLTFRKPPDAPASSTELPPPSQQSSDATQPKETKTAPSRPSRRRTSPKRKR